MSILGDVFPTRKLSLSKIAALAAAAPIRIPFRVQRQGRHGQWCWAAVTASVSGYPDPPFSNPVTMCKLASDVLDRRCCDNPTEEGCEVQNSLDGPLARIGRLREPVINGFLGPAAVATELRADLPLPIRVAWTRSGNGGHFIAIRGISMIPGGVQYDVTDPIHGESSVMGAALISGGYLARGGTWTHSYVVTV